MKLVSLCGVWMCLLSSAARFKRIRRETKGKVSGLYTFGAPHISSAVLAKPGGGCWNGYRVVNYDWDLGIDDEDIVTVGLKPFGFEHPNIKTIGLKASFNGIKHEWACGEIAFRITRGSLPLHFWWNYLANIGRTGNAFPDMATAAFVGMNNSYGFLKDVKANVEKQGWRFVGTARAREDRSHLMQHPQTHECIVTFEGSDAPSDFVTDAAIVKVGFCDIPGNTFHLGFRNELRRVVGSASWQKEIRPKLSKCSSVNAVGHSLGGAVATLFTACLEYANGSDDYKLMSWTPGPSERLPSVQL